MDLGLRKRLTPLDQHPKILEILKTICKDLRILHGLIKTKTPSWASNSDSNERRPSQPGKLHYAVIKSKSRLTKKYYIKKL